MRVGKGQDCPGVPFGYALGQKVVYVSIYVDFIGNWSLVWTMRSSSSLDIDYGSQHKPMSSSLR